VNEAPIMRTVKALSSWMLALFLAAMFLQATVHPLPNPPEGMVKLFDRPGENIVFVTLAAQTGLSWLEPGGRVIVAGLELVAAMLVIVPASRRLGAFFSAVIMLGAVGTHLMPGVLGREVPRSLDPASAVTDGGALFALAIAMLTASLLLYLIQR